MSGGKADPHSVREGPVAEPFIVKADPDDSRLFGRMFRLVSLAMSVFKQDEATGGTCLRSPFTGQVFGS